MVLGVFPSGRDVFLSPGNGGDVLVDSELVARRSLVRAIHVPVRRSLGRFLTERTSWAESCVPHRVDVSLLDEYLHLCGLPWLRYVHAHPEGPGVGGMRDEHEGFPCGRRVGLGLKRGRGGHGGLGGLQSGAGTHRGLATVPQGRGAGGEDMLLGRGGGGLLCVWGVVVYGEEGAPLLEHGHRVGSGMPRWAGVIK